MTSPGGSYSFTLVINLPRSCQGLGGSHQPLFAVKVPRLALMRSISDT